MNKTVNFIEENFVGPFVYFQIHVALAVTKKVQSKLKF